MIALFKGIAVVFCTVSVFYFFYRQHIHTEEYRIIEEIMYTDSSEWIE